MSRIRICDICGARLKKEYLKVEREVLTAADARLESLGRLDVCSDCNGKFIALMKQIREESEQ